MFSSLYRRIAQNNLQKNYRYYVPRILTEAGLTACFYIMLTLALEPKMKNIYGGEYLPTFMMLGTFILAILSVVLLMYTAKFLMKQRMQEYGLYYALGMEKKHVARVFGYESGISSAAGIGIGIGSGILFYKLSLLILTKMMGTETIPKVSLILPAALGGEKLNLKGNEIALCSLRTSVDYSMKILNLNHQKLKVRKWINYFPVKENGSSLSNTKRYGIVVAEESIARRLNQNHAFSTVNCLGVGFKNPAQTYREGEEFTRIFRQRVTSILAEDYGIRGVVPAVDSAWDVKGALKSMYGSFLFLGILLGMVFLFATVLIIYYKQISEGYEDRKRFQIMEKVGMSSGEVKKTIQSQVRMVFFLPVMVAGVHTAVAFPILIELLKVLMLTNKALFIGCGLGAYGMYVLGYGIIYRLTSRIYYRIVR